MKKPFTKAEQLAFLRAKIESDPRWTERALIRIFEAQTESEQATATTNHTNGVGFTGSDANFLTGCAKGVLRYGHLSERQLYFVKMKIGKYAHQLMNSSTFKEDQLIAIMQKAN